MAVDLQQRAGAPVAVETLAATRATPLRGRWARALLGSLPAALALAATSAAARPVAVFEERAPFVSPLAFALEAPAADLRLAPPLPADGTPGQPGWVGAAAFAGGAATAFLAHEGCHLAANLAFGNRPALERVAFLGAIPFFSVSPGISCAGGRCQDRDGLPFRPGPRGVYTIVTGGLQCQQYGDEAILTLRPGLRGEEAPFLKGMLAFNTLTSMAYVAANWSGAEPPAGDLRNAVRDARAPRHTLNALLLGVAALDLARYAWPDVAWLAWVSRASKVTVTGLVFTL